MTGVRTGLSYAALESVLRLLAIPADRHAEIFAGIRVMEHAALVEFARQAEEAPRPATTPR